jgi:hypothetical protein
MRILSFHDGIVDPSDLSKESCEKHAADIANDFGEFHPHPTIFVFLVCNFPRAAVLLRCGVGAGDRKPIAGLG